MNGEASNRFIELKYCFPLWAVLFTILLGGCSTERYIPEDQYLLTKNKIVITDPENVEDKTKLEYQLSSLHNQVPNSNFLFFFPKEGFYYRNDEPKDTSWYRRWIKRDLAQIPAILDTNATQKTAEEMELFLRNLKGYYHAKVETEQVLSRKNARVNYLIKTGKRYYVNSVQYIGYDEEVISIIEDIKEKAIVKEGAPIDVSLFDKEKNRISQHLQNIGYANFKSNRLKIYGDSAGLDQKVDIFLELIPKPDSSNYQKYSIGQINIHTDYIQGQDLSKSEVLKLDNKNFLKQSTNFIVKPSILNKFISFDSGEYYNDSERIKTFKKLNSLDVYRFSQLKPKINPQKDSILDFDVYLTPQNSKWVSDLGLETFYSSVNNFRQTIGSSFFASLENRNLFGGAEYNRLNFEIGGEFQFNAVNVGLVTSTIRIQDNLEIPTMIDVFKTAAIANKLKLLSNERYDNFKREAKTNIGFGFSKINFIGLYDITSFNAAIGYSYYPNSRHQFSMQQLGLNLNGYNLSNEFLARISNNPFIVNSLEDNLLTGFLFRDFNYIYSSPKSVTGNSFKLIANFELSGWEIALLNGARNMLSDTNKFWQLFGEYEYSKFYRVELDGRFYHDFDPSSSFAARFNIGLARPYFDSNQVPFIKQFYVGGPSGIRAWQIRELGPGSYDLPETISSNTTPFFQQGDFKMQFSLEYRLDVVSFLETAFFIDGGNVWTFSQSDPRQGSQLSNSFLNDIALGYGYGLRFDLSYFIIRFDFGYKLRRPYTNDKEGRWFRLRPQGIGNINIAINYPF